MLELDGGANPEGTSLALARKWRPLKFADLVGQEHVVRALTGALGRGNFHHAFMFTGTRGIGKTTLARILAKGFNCEQLTEGEPCGSCPQCTQVDSGSHPDVIEMDAASTTQVDSMRSLLDSAQYAPALGRYKVYIIDEVHMLSRHSFNAMLKTLEEPPEHVKFILATTDPQQVPATVQSRCLRFSLRRLAVDLIIARLQHILQAEGHSYSDAALAIIAEHADGSMRDALSILDEALASSPELAEEPIRELVGAAGPEQAPELLACLLNNDAGGVLERTTELFAQARLLDRICAELVTLLHQAQLVALAPELSQTAHPVVHQAASQLDTIALQVAYEIASHGREQVAKAPEAKVALDMVLLRILALMHPASKTKTAAPANSTEPTPTAAEKTQPASTPPTAPKAKKQELPANADDWQAICDQLKKGPAAVLAAECIWVATNPDELVLKMQQNDDDLLGYKASLEQALQEKFAQPNLAVTIEVTDANLDEPAPSAIQQQEADRKKKQQLEELENLATTKEIKKKFPGAKVAVTTTDD